MGMIMKMMSFHSTHLTDCSLTDLKINWFPLALVLQMMVMTALLLSKFAKDQLGAVTLKTRMECLLSVAQWNILPMLSGTVPLLCLKLWKMSNLPCRLEVPLTNGLLIMYNLVSLLQNISVILTSCLLLLLKNQA